MNRFNYVRAMESHRHTAASPDSDSTPFEQRVLHYQDRLFRLCRYLLKNPHDAEDAAQESLAKAYQNLASYTPGTPFYSWLSRIAVNTCLDHQRRDAVRALFLFTTAPAQLDSHAAPAPDPESRYATSQELQNLQRALRQLSAKLRTVIVLKELEGLSYEEIAALLDLSMGTVKSRISRAREEIVRLMKKSTEQNLF